MKTPSKYGKFFMSKDENSESWLIQLNLAIMKLHRTFRYLCYIHICYKHARGKKRKSDYACMKEMQAWCFQQTSIFWFVGNLLCRYKIRIELNWFLFKCTKVTIRKERTKGINAWRGPPTCNNSTLHTSIGSINRSDWKLTQGNIQKSKSACTTLNTYTNIK